MNEIPENKETEKKGSGRKYILIFSILLIAIAAGTFYWWYEANEDRNPSQPPGIGDEDEDDDDDLDDEISWHTKPKFEYEDMQAIGWSGLWAAKKDGLWGVVDVYNGVKYDFQYDEISFCSSHGMTFDKSQSEGESLTLSFRGERTWDCGHGSSNYYWDIKEDKLVYSAEGPPSYDNEEGVEFPTVVQQIEVTGLDSEEGWPNWDWEYWKKAGKFGIVEGTKLITPAEYDYLKEKIEGTQEYEDVEGENLGYNVAGWLVKSEKMKDTIYAAKKDGKAGFIDKNNHVLIPFVFQEADRFNGDIAAVKSDGLWGFIYSKRTF